MTTLVIDGKTVSVARGRTILEACRENGIAVPTLCHLAGLTPAGACRLCVVEVRGLTRPVAACSTPALEGMIVTTSTARLRQHRRAMVELMMAAGDHVCAYCPASGRCELQEAAREAGVDHFSRADHARRRHRELDASHPRFAFDPGRCVLCTRCVRVCAEVEGARTLGVGGRGASTLLFTDGGERWADSASCTSCGRCLVVCPTGALMDKATAARVSGASGPGVRVDGASAFGTVRASGSVPSAVSLSNHPATPAPAPGRRPRAATVWLGGCSGCHMSLLDLDEELIALWRGLELVYSPLVDAKRYPEAVDLCLVEGAVATEDNLEMLRTVRRRTRTLVALGDCAATGNVTAMRDARGGARAVLRRAWIDGAAPSSPPRVPALLEPVHPLHEVVDVDAFVPGCPPPARAIAHAVTELLAGRRCSLHTGARFG